MNEGRALCSYHRAYVFLLTLSSRPEWPAPAGHAAEESWQPTTHQHRGNPFATSHFAFPAGAFKLPSNFCASANSACAAFVSFNRNSDIPKL
jgi:hypothetical protein